MTDTLPLFHGRTRDLAAAAAARIETRLEEPRLEEARIGILVPSRAFGDQILARLLENRPAITGIRIHTIDSLARAIVNDAGAYPAVSNDTMQRLAMTAAVRQADDIPFDAPGLPSLLHRSWRDVRDSGVSLDDFARRAGVATLESRDRIDAARSIWSRREEALRSTAMLDQADLIEDAIARLASGAHVERQILTGFYDVTGLQQKFIDALAAAGGIEAIFLPVCLEGSTPLPPYGFANRFTSRALEIATGAEPIRENTVESDLRIVRFRDRTTEIRETIRVVRALVDAGTPPRSIAVVSRTVRPALESLVTRIARSFDVGVAGAGARPFRSHRIPRAIVQLLRLGNRRWARGDVIEILHAGFDPGHGWFRTRDVVELDRITRHHGIAGGTAAEIRAILPRIEKERPGHGEIVERFAAAVASLDERLAPVSPSMSGASWSAWLGGIVDRFRFDDEHDLGAAERIDAIADTLRRCDALGPWIETEDVAALIETADDLPVRSSRAPVWFGDVMQLRGRVFEHVFVIAVEEEIFPQQRTADPILTDDDRRALGLREIGDGLDEERLLLQLAMDAATTAVTLSFANADSAGRPSRPSSLLKELATGLDPQSELQILGDFGAWVDARSPDSPPIQNATEGLRDAILRGDEDVSVPPGVVRALRVARASGSRSPWDGWLHPTEPLRAALRQRLGQISPTHLEDFGECPQRFFFKRFLRAREVEDPDHEIEMERRRRGNVVHGILETFYRALADSDIRGSAARRALPDALHARLATVVDEAFDADSAGHPPFNSVIRAIEQANLRKAIARFVATDLADLDRNGLFPRHFEMRFGDWGDGVETERRTLELGGIEMGIRGRIDRVDRSHDGRVRVVDYKSGTANHLHKLAEQIDKGTALQVPLYALVAAKIFEAPDDKITGSIKPLRPMHPADEFEFNLGEKREALERVLEIFVERIVAGVFPAWPGNDHACGFCPVGDSCRTRHDPELKYTALAAKSVIGLVDDEGERDG